MAHTIHFSLMLLLDETIPLSEAVVAPLVTGLGRLFRSGRGGAQRGSFLEVTANNDTGYP